MRGNRTRGCNFRALRKIADSPASNNARTEMSPDAPAHFLHTVLGTQRVRIDGMVRLASFLPITTARGASCPRRLI